MTAVRALIYLRYAFAVAWSALRGRPCACEFCRAHRAFIAESEPAYRAEVRSLLAGHQGAAP